MVGCFYLEATTQMAMTAPMLSPTCFRWDLIKFELSLCAQSIIDHLHLDREEEGVGVPGGGESPPDATQHLEPS